LIPAFLQPIEPPIHDAVSWGPTPDEKFLVKSATRSQKKDNRAHPKSDLLDYIWKANVLPKIKKLSLDVHHQGFQHKLLITYLELLSLAEIFGSTGNWHTVLDTDEHYVDWMGVAKNNFQTLMQY
jgi:hypothetical protein